MDYTEKIEKELQIMTPKLRPSEYVEYIKIYTNAGLEEAYQYIKATTENR